MLADREGVPLGPHRVGLVRGGGRVLVTQEVGDVGERGVGLPHRTVETRPQGAGRVAHVRGEPRLAVRTRPRVGLIGAGDRLTRRGEKPALLAETQRPGEPLVRLRHGLDALRDVEPIGLGVAGGEIEDRAQSTHRRPDEAQWPKVLARFEAVDLDAQPIAEQSGTATVVFVLDHRARQIRERAARQFDPFGDSVG